MPLSRSFCKLFYLSISHIKWEACTLPPIFTYLTITLSFCDVILMLSPLSSLHPGQAASIVRVFDNMPSSFDSASIGRRLQDLGFEPGAGVVCVLEKGKNGISAFLIKGAVIALRKEDADLILVEESE